MCAFILIIIDIHKLVVRPNHKNSYAQTKYYNNNTPHEPIFHSAPQEYNSTLNCITCTKHFKKPLYLQKNPTAKTPPALENPPHKSRFSESPNPPHKNNNNNSTRRRCRVALCTGEAEAPSLSRDGTRAARLSQSAAGDRLTRGCGAPRALGVSYLGQRRTRDCTHGEVKVRARVRRILT